MSFTSFVQKAAVLFLVSLSFLCASQALAESIEQFSVKAYLQPDRRLDIEEAITYDFGNDDIHHGIIRTIPNIYGRSWFDYGLDLQVDDVLLDGYPVQYTESMKGNALNIKIGSGNISVDGVHTYTIKYHTSRAINEFPDHQELYWNVTGDEWTVPIRKADFSFQGPITNQLKCYTGVYGSTAQDCSISFVSSTERVSARTFLGLDESEGLTVVLGFPKGSIAEEPWLTKLFYLLKENLILLLPFAGVLVMLVIWFIWGRDPKGRGVIIPEYAPPAGTTPALMEILVRQTAYSSVFVSTLLDLARRGWIKFSFDGNVMFPKVFARRLIPEPKDTRRPYEELLMKAFFGTNFEVNLMTPPTKTRWAELEEVKNLLLGEAIALGWFRRNPVHVRNTWMIIGGIIFGLAIFTSNVWLFSLAIPIILFGWYMPRVTRKGALALEHVLGFKHFLKVTEEQRLAFSDAPARRPEQFAEFLPAAVSLGVEREWIKQFASLNVPPPSYFEASHGSWNSLLFVQGLSRATHTMSISPNKSGGAGGGSSGFSGGSSGGGFGGGGGSSW